MIRPEKMRRYLDIYWLMVRNSLIREMSFKANFLLWMVVELLWFLGQIVFIEVLFSYVDVIGDWTKWEVVLLVGTHQLTSQIFQAFFYENLASIPELIRTGRLDLMLTLPVDAQFAVSTRRFGLDNIVNAWVGIAIVTVALVKLGIVPAPWQVGLYAAAVLVGVGIHYAVFLALATLAFWIVRAQGIIYGYFNLFNIGRYPEVVFKGGFRFFFSYVIPVILVANVPARILTGASPAPGLAFAHLAAVTVAVFIATRLFWLLALRRYASASS